MSKLWKVWSFQMSNLKYCWRVANTHSKCFMWVFPPLRGMQWSFKTSSNTTHRFWPRPSTSSGKVNSCCINYTNLKIHLKKKMSSLRKQYVNIRKLESSFQHTISGWDQLAGCLYCTNVRPGRLSKTRHSSTRVTSVPLGPHQPGFSDGVSSRNPQTP
jgi:hypothetical protein